MSEHSPGPRPSPGPPLASLAGAPTATVVLGDATGRPPPAGAHPGQEFGERQPPEGQIPALPRLQQPARGQRLLRKPAAPAPALTPAQRLLLGAWRRSGLPAGDFAALVGVSKHTLYAWNREFQEHGPDGLEDKPHGAPAGSRPPEVTCRAILMMKESHPDWGVEKISALLLRGPALPASPQAVARVLHEAGYEAEEVPTHPHPDKERRFERARPNQRALVDAGLLTITSDPPDHRTPPGL